MPGSDFRFDRPFKGANRYSCLMAKSPTSELFSTLKTYFNQLSDGERTPAEVATAFNGWAKESAESVKAKIAEEVEATVSKMGFIKREEYDLLLARVSQLEQSASLKVNRTAAPKKQRKSAISSVASEQKRTLKKSNVKKSNVKKLKVEKVSK